MEIFTRNGLNQFLLMWKDSVSQDSHKDVNLKLKYNGKFV